MKTPPGTPEMARFNDALRQVMTVTKPELKALLSDSEAIEATRQKRGPMETKPRLASRTWGTHIG
jgi:hypothetical protein